ASAAVMATWRRRLRWRCGGTASRPSARSPFRRFRRGQPASVNTTTNRARRLCMAPTRTSTTRPWTDGETNPSERSKTMSIENADVRDLLTLSRLRESEADGSLIDLGPDVPTVKRTGASAPSVTRTEYRDPLPDDMTEAMHAAGVP